MSISYAPLKRLAYEKRQAYGIKTQSLGLQKIRKVYKAEGVTIDLWNLSARIRAVYMCDDGEPSVLVNKRLPKEPRLFSLVHELKHHFVDRSLIGRGELKCGDYNANKEIEIGAEVFAAEFIYPEAEFLACLDSLGIARGRCSAKDVVMLKRACNATVSYTFLAKRLQRLGFVEVGAFDGVQFTKLEEQVFGVPIYKQSWFIQRRRVRQSMRRG
jgi:Zn-dependent peptidase ImmA (M78 family)